LQRFYHAYEEMSSLAVPCGGPAEAKHWTQSGLIFYLLTAFDDRPSKGCARGRNLKST
jgi:hypothetical protein